MFGKALRIANGKIGEPKLGCESLGEQRSDLGDLFPYSLGSVLEHQNLPNHRVARKD